MPAGRKVLQGSNAEVHNESRILLHTALGADKVYINLKAAGEYAFTIL